MATFRADEVDNYGNQGGGGGFFSITNDRGKKRVRFLYNTTDEIEGMSVHKVKVPNKDGQLKDRYVNCLREYDQPIEDCPFCREHKKTEARIFIPIYNIEEDSVQVWDRGKSMFQTLMGQCSRYSNKDTDIVNNIFEIERMGKPKDKKTQYQIYYIEKDDTTLEDLPEAPQILGKIVLDKTADDMEYYLENEEFPPTEDDEEEEDEPPVRRRDSREREDSHKERDDSRRDTRRRTPARSSRRNEDEY